MSISDSKPIISESTAGVVMEKETEETIRAINMFALEFTLLQYHIANEKIDTNSRSRLMAIREQRRSQAIGLEADLFAEVLDVKRGEWTSHWNAWAPGAARPALDGKETEKAKLDTLARFAAEVVLLEFRCVDAGLGLDALKRIVHTIDRCHALAMHVDADEYQKILTEKWQEWMSHWLEWGSSFDEHGRVEYGMISGTEELMVGQVVMLKKTADGQEDVLVGAKELIEYARAEYSKLRTNLLGGT